jgi:hypothetical protein
MIALTEQQGQELARAEETPPSVFDPATNTTYVLVRADVYERIREFVADDGLDMRQVALLVERAMRDDDAGDPTLAFYQQKYGKSS